MSRAGKAKKLRIATVQLRNAEYSVDKNLLHAEQFISQLSSQNAQLILLPELFAVPYLMSSEIWGYAESLDGKTIRWIKMQAIRFGIWIATTILERKEKEFYNSFVLVDPDGETQGVVRKSRPAAVETFFFKGCDNPHVIETPLGRIGVSICYEGFLASVVNNLFERRADLVLMPHSAPTPTLSPGIKPSYLEEYDRAIQHTAINMAKTLGVPTVMANKTGVWKTATPLFFPDEDSSFPGFSCIVDSRANVVAGLDAGEGMAVAEILLCPEAKQPVLAQFKGKWSQHVPRIFSLFVIPETLGKLFYWIKKPRVS